MDAHAHSHLHWPFFEDSHRSVKAGLDTWCDTQLQDATHDESRAAVDAQAALVEQYDPEPKTFSLN